MATDAFLVMDRVVTATTMTSLVQALLGLREALREGMTLPYMSDTNNSDDEIDETTALFKAFVSILHGTHAACVGATQRDEALQALLRLYLQLGKSNDKNSDSVKKYYQTWLSIPDSTTWIQALVDVATNTLQYASYTRVLSLQTLVQAAKHDGRRTQQALLEIPQALLRLAELLTNETVTDDQVRSVVLQDLAPIIADWPAAAKVWVLAADVPQHVLRFLVHQEGGWTGGNVVVADGLQLITKLLSHDAMAAELVTQSAPDWGRLLGQLLDLRKGQAFLHPSKPSSSTTVASTSTIMNDDLDDLLASGDGKNASTSIVRGTKQDSNIAPVPRLLESEENILRHVLQLLRTLLSNESVRRRIWKQERPLMALAWDWACMGPPPPDATHHSQYPCAFSSIALQCEVLELCSAHLNDASVLLDPQWNGLDRLLYLVCTGGPGTTATERLQVSQAAVSLLRACFTNDMVQEFVLAALAPPLPDDVADQGATDVSINDFVHIRRIVVPKLLQTVADNLHPSEPIASSPLSSRVGLVGAVSALQLFLGSTEAQKSLLLKLTTPALLHDIWQRIGWEVQQMKNQEQQDAATLTIATLLRFVGNWMRQAPLVAQALLKDADSPTLVGQCMMLTAVEIWDDKEGNVHGSLTNNTVLIPSLASLVLGLALTHNKEEFVEEEYGGWTKNTIVRVIKQGVGGLSQRIAEWEALKMKMNTFCTADGEALLPWTTNELEMQEWTNWYNSSVLQVRKALVEFVTVQKDDSDDDDGDDDQKKDDNGAGAKRSGSSRKNLQALVAQQAEELEFLREELQASHRKIESQEKQLMVWKQRVESTPTELDQMLSDYGTKTEILNSTVRELRASLSERDEMVSTLESRMSALEGSELEATQERDRLQDEMTALSEAYGSLEDEYRRLEEQNRDLLRQQRSSASEEAAREPTTAAGEDPSGVVVVEPADIATEQPQGESPDQGSSMEVAILRAENNRIRETARQADDWMRMAVDRMSALDAQLVESQQRIAELETQLVETQNLDSASLLASIQKEHRALQRREEDLCQTLATEQKARTRADERLAAAKQEASLKQQLEDSFRADLEQALDQTKKEVVILKQEVLLMQSQNHDIAREDTRTMDSLKVQGETATAELESSRASIEALCSENKSLLAKVEELEAQLAWSTSFSHHDSDGPVASTLIQAPAEVGLKTQDFQSQLALQDALIRTLQSQLADLVENAIPVDDSVALRSQIEQLNKSNEAAQAWMAQAVEHHQALNEQIRSLQEENSALAQLHSSSSMGQNEGALRGELETMSKQLSEAQVLLGEKENQMTTMISEHEMTVKELQNTVARLSNVSATPNASSILMLGRGLSKVSSDASYSLETQQDLSALLAENEQLRNDKALVDQRIYQIELEYEQMKSELAVLTHEHQDLKDELARMEGLEINQDGDGIHNLRQNLSETGPNQAHFDPQLESRGSKNGEHPRTRDKTTAQDDSTMILQAEMQKLRQELSDKTVEAERVISQWEAAYNDLQDRFETIQQGCSSIDLSDHEMSNDALRQEIDYLRAQIEVEKAGADDAISQWQASYEVLQKENDTLRAAVALNTESDASKFKQEALQKQLQLRDASKESNRDTSEGGVSLSTLQSPQIITRSNAIIAVSEPDFETTSDLQERVHALEERLQEEASEAQNAISQWQDSYMELEKRYEALKNESTADELSEALLANSELTTRLELLQKKLENEAEERSTAISHWKSSYDDLLQRYDDLVFTKKETDGKNSGLEEHVEPLQKQLQEERRKIDVDIGEWQESYEKLREEYDALQRCHADTASPDVESDVVAKLRIQLEAIQEEFQAERREADEVVAQWEISYNELKSCYDALESKIGTDDSCGTIIDDLKTQVQALERQLQDDARNANNSILELQSSYEAMKKRYDALLADRTVSKVEDSSLSQLQSEMGALRKQMDDDANEAETVIGQWEESYSAIESENEDLHRQLRALQLEKAPLKSSGETRPSPSRDYDVSRLRLEADEACRVLEEMKATSHLLENQLRSCEEENTCLAQQVKILSEKLALDSKKSDDTLSNWQVSYHSLETKYNELADAYADMEEKANSTVAERDNMVSRITSLESELGCLKVMLIEAEEKAKGVTEQCNQQELVIESENERASEMATKLAHLEGTVRELEARLIEEARDADDAVAQWQDSYGRMEEINQQLQLDIAASKENEIHLLNELESVQSEFDKVNKDFIGTNLAHEAEVSALKEKLTSLQAEYDHSLKSSNAQMEIEELLEELRDVKFHREEESRLVTKMQNEWQDSYHELEMKYGEITDELTAKKDALDLIVSEKKYFTAKLEEMTSELEQRQRGAVEAFDAMANLQTSIDSLREDKLKLKIELERAQAMTQTLLEEKDDLLSKLSTTRESEMDETIQRLRDELSTLRQHREEEARDADDAIAQWQEDHAALLADLEKAGEKISVAQSSQHELEARLKEMLQRIAELEAATENPPASSENVLGELEKMTERAISAEEMIEAMRVLHSQEIAQKESTIFALEEKMTRESEIRNDDLQAIDRLAEEAEHLRDINAKLREELDQAQDLNSQMERELDLCEEVINDWKARFDDLQRNEKELKNDLEQQRLEAEEAITLWEKQCGDVSEELLRERQALQDKLKSESQAKLELGKNEILLSDRSEIEGDLSLKCANLESILDNEKKLSTAAKERIDELENTLSETEARLTSRIESMQTDQARAKTEEEAYRMHQRELTDEFERRNEAQRSEKAAMECELDRLRSKISDQGNEIRELFNSLKLYKTNEISAHAAKVAAEELKKELDVLRRQIVENSRVIQAEKTSRLAAEQETRSVRGDLAALLGLEDTEDNQSEIRRRTIEAAEHFQRKEQAEIEKLRDALTKALNQLDKLRYQAQQAEDRALRAELKFSSVEEEHMSAQKELKYLSISLGEARDFGVSNCLSLESRIADLESDLVVLRRFHASEMNTLRDELSKTIVERDHLVQVLNNAEASKASLLQTITKGAQMGNLDAEIRRVRLENTSILAQVSGETARTERRIREARTADRLASQTQLLVERELRCATERALGSAKEQLARTQQSESQDNPPSEDGMLQLSVEVEELRDRNAVLSQQLSELRRHLEEIRRDSRHEAEKLKEECRQAKSRATQLEQKGRFEAEVRAEVARIQLDESQSVVAHLGNVVETDCLDGMDSKVTATRLYDIIEQQRQQIEEERRVHHAQKADFEHLLALLTQHDLYQRFLIQALEAASGKETVKEVLRQAKRTAEEHFG